jgi:hypothetical protein
LGAVFVACLILLLPPVALIAPAQVVVQTYWAPPPRHRTSNFVFLILIWASFTLAIDYFEPSPLPHVAVTMPGGRTVRGDLLVASGPTYYVGTGSKQFVAIRSSPTKAVRITSQMQDQGKSLFEILTGHKLFGLPAN